MNADEPSLLTHLNEIRERNEEGGISVVIFCGTYRTDVSDVDASSVLQLQRKVVEEEVNDSGVNITGILMAQGNSILHMLEGPSESVLKILKLLSLENQFKNRVQSGRIVLNLEDRPQRSFPEWYSCYIQERDVPGDEKQLEANEFIVVDLANGLFEIGKKLQTEVVEEVELNKYADNLPQKNLILELCNSTNFFELEEFVNTYTAPMFLELESEKIWPLERIVIY